MGSISVLWTAAFRPSRLYCHTEARISSLLLFMWFHISLTLFLHIFWYAKRFVSFSTISFHCSAFKTEKSGSRRNRWQRNIRIRSLAPTLKTKTSRCDFFPQARIPINLIRAYHQLQVQQNSLLNFLHTHLESLLYKKTPPLFILCLICKSLQYLAAL